MSDKKPILVFKPNKFIFGSQLFEIRKLLMQQMKEGCVVLPYGWDYAIVNPDVFEGEIIVEDMK